MSLIVEVLRRRRWPQINLSRVFARQNVGVTRVGERIRLVTFIHNDLGYFDDEEWRLETIQKPFGPGVTYVLGRNCHPCDRNDLLPMSPEQTTRNWLAALDDFRNWLIREAA